MQVTLACEHRAFFPTLKTQHTKARCPQAITVFLNIKKDELYERNF